MNFYNNTLTENWNELFAPCRKLEKNCTLMKWMLSSFLFPFFTRLRYNSSLLLVYPTRSYLFFHISLCLSVFFTFLHSSSSLSCIASEQHWHYCMNSMWMVTFCREIKLELKWERRLEQLDDYMVLWQWRVHDNDANNTVQRKKLDWKIVEQWFKLGIKILSYCIRFLIKFLFIEFFSIVKILIIFFFTTQNMMSRWENWLKVQQ